MGGNQYLDREALPPRPDPVTGLPRPPHAPTGHRAVSKESADRDDSLADAPPPPPGQGPVLAWYRSSRRFALRNASVGVAFVTVALWAGEGFDFHWVGQWWAWLILAVGVTLGAMGGVAERTGFQYSAGAEWASCRRGWVRTYELAHVKVTTGQDPFLLLRDRAGRRASFVARAMQNDGLLWDLIYNGILHSVVDGDVDMDAATRRRLRLPAPGEQHRNP